MQPQRGTPDIPVTVHYLGLFCWANQMLSFEDISAVAATMIGQPGVQPSTNHPGWFDGPLVPNQTVTLFSGTPKQCQVQFSCSIAVTHSRIIVTIDLELTKAEIESQEFLRTVRDALAAWLRSLLAPRLNTLFSSAPIQLKFPTEVPDPFLFFYPLIVIPGYGETICKEVESRPGEVALDDLSTCFAVRLRDPDAEHWYTPRLRYVFLRISGASVITGGESAVFSRRLVNLLYYAGLYEMTRRSVRVPRPAAPGVTSPRVQFGLEALLEKQGEAILNSFTQRGIEEVSLSISRKIVLLTVVLLVVTIASSLVLKFGP